MTIDLPESILAAAEASADRASLEISEWFARLLVEVIGRNEIHHLRNDVIDWREELLS